MLTKYKPFPNQDKCTVRAGINRFDNFRTTERSGTMDTMIQVIYVVFVDLVTAMSQICALFLFLSDKCLTYGVLEYMWETLVFSVSKGESGKC